MRLACFADADSLSLGSYSKYCRMGGLKNIHLFLMVLEVGKSKIRVPVDLGSHESPPPSLAWAAFLLCPYMVERTIISLMTTCKDVN